MTQPVPLLLYLFYTLVSICSPNKDKRRPPPGVSRPCYFLLQNWFMVTVLEIPRLLNEEVIQPRYAWWRPMFILHRPLQMETATKILIKMHPLSTDGAILILVLIYTMQFMIS